MGAHYRKMGFGLVTAVVVGYFVLYVSGVSIGVTDNMMTAFTIFSMMIILLIVYEVFAFMGKTLDVMEEKFQKMDKGFEEVIQLKVEHMLHEKKALQELSEKIEGPKEQA